MRILVGTVGTRGDVQPCIAVALALRAAGHDVTVGTHTEYEADVRRRGLGFRPVAGSIRAMVDSPKGREWLESGAAPLRYRRLLGELFGPIQQSTIDDADAAVEGHDAVVYYPLAVHFLHAAERRRLPTVAIPFYPFVPTGEIQPLLLPPWLPAPPLVRRKGWELLHALILRSFHETHVRHRERVGLPPLRSMGLTAHAFDLRIPHVHLLSPSVMPRPRDWPDWATMSGFCFLDAVDWKPPPGLEAFLAAGPKPIYVGFGSMTGRDPAELSAVVAGAIRRAEVRAVVARGWGALDLADGPHVYVVDEVPHDWLFERVAAVVHHGGVGTLAAGLRAGRPTVVVPFFGDQPLWATRVRTLGVGPRALDRSSVSAGSLASAVREAVDSPAIAERAAAIGERVRAEEGLATTVRAIETAIRLTSRAGGLHRA